jgi:RNA recognition motif-containing protein
MISRQVVKITPADPKNTLHIGNIPKNVTEEELKQHVVTYGKVSIAPIK